MSAVGSIRLFGWDLIFWFWRSLTVSVFIEFLASEQTVASILELDIFLPLLLFTGVVWYLFRLFSRQPALNRVAEDLVIGRRLLPGEVEGEFTNYVDLTAEFAEPLVIRRLAGYRSFPILDGAAPDLGELLDVIGRLSPGRTFIHCAQRHGRTGLFALALMLKIGMVQTCEEGLEKLRSVRPGINLSAVQSRCIESVAGKLRLT